MRLILITSTLLLSTLLSACTTRAPQPDPQRAIGERLDALHAAAARADSGAYFECFTDDAVFLGTDATERWAMPEFKVFCKPYFDAGRGWTYVPRDRHILLQAKSSPRLAWFDELLHNDKYGTCRGSGVLVRVDGKNRPSTWKVAHYSLSFMIPNEKAAEVTAITQKK
jgi:ketosteroid isomerase-like protein